MLAADGVQAAKSGHPGMPMGMAAAAYTLWTRFLHYSPENPHWANRDRFVLSAGHGSMLLYSMLHLTGYDLPLEELRNFRQWGSKTPGHPEVNHTPGVETTTGPLGQGFANGVGMAMAEAWLAARYNRPGFNLVDHYTYAIAGDGDLMEGVASEAASLAGHLQLGKLILLYDDNGITIDGKTEIAYTEDVQALRGLRLACAAHRRAGHGRRRRSHRGRTGRPAPQSHRLPHGDRLWQPQQRRHLQGAWRGAGRGRTEAHQGESGLAARAALLRP